MSETLERRLRQHRSRLLIRSWDYRQRHHARGVWYRLRRLLASTERAFAIDTADVDRLIEQGYREESIGLGLEPPRRILAVPADVVTHLPTARQIPVSLNRELLAAPGLALVPFDETV